MKARSIFHFVLSTFLLSQLIGGFALAGNLDLAPFAQGVFSGTEPFNTSGNCHEPGDDCGSEDARVRTGDLIRFAWSITTTDFVPGDADFAAVIFEQTISASDRAKVQFDRIPTVCRPYPAGPGGSQPVSTLTDHSDGSQTLLCNLGSMGEGEQKSFSIPVRASANSENGSQFRSTQLVYALNDAGLKVVANTAYVDETVYEISAAPAFDLMADRKDMYQGQRVVEDLGNGAGPEPGYMVYINAHIAADARRKGKGVEALDESVSFNAVINTTNKDGVTPIDIPFKMMECLPNPSPWPDTVYGNQQIASAEPLAAKVPDSGTCSFSGNDQSGYTFTLNGIDSQGLRYPTETTTGESLSAGPFFVAAYQIGLFVPFSAIEASDGDSSGNGGAVNLSTCLTDFDPMSNAGVSNYASGVEPGYNGSIMPDGAASNNCTGPLTLQLSSGGGYNHRLVSTVDDKGNYLLEPLIDVAHIGATSVEATTRYAHMERFSNTGSETLDDFQACMKFDNTVSKLIDASLVGASSGQYAFVADDTTANFDHSKWQVLYGSADLASDSPVDRDADGVRDFDPTTGRFEGNWASLRSVVCADNSVERWVTDPKELGIDNVNIVRFVGRGEPVAIQPGQTFRSFLPLEMRAKFVGGPDDGQAIPVGTVAAAMSSFRTDQFYPEWRPIQYSPSPESSQGDGDRVTYTRISVNALLSTEIPLAPPGVTESVLAGNDVIMKITPSVASGLPAGGIAQGFQLVSVLPQGSSFNADCTTQLPNGSTPSLIRHNTPTTGQQTLTWELGNIHSSGVIDPIIFCASTDPFGHEGSAREFQAYARAANATASVLARQTVLLGQSGEIRAAAQVDVAFDGVNDTQVHTLKWLNFSDTTTIDNPVVINVLPYNADALGDSPRAPTSTFSGTLTMLSEPTVRFADNSEPALGEQALGTIYYTADNASSISDNPNINTSFWCSYESNQFESVGAMAGVCPTTFAEVTALKFVSNYELARNGNPRQGQLLTYETRAQGNAPGNRYTNAFRFDSADLTGTQTVFGRPSTIVIISHSIGDLIFVDLNEDGKYTSGVDVLAPDGVPVELRLDADDSLVDSTTTVNGTFLFDLLADGDYYVSIPASAFGADKALRDWSVAPNAKTSKTNANHDVDHSGVSNGLVSVNGVRTDVVSLSTVTPVLPVDAPTGLEPLGDNLFGLTDDNTNDDFSNLTADIGLVSGDADNDGIPDILEFGSNSLSDFIDSDNDGLPNYLDPDSDNDGINDGVEAGSFNLAQLTLPKPDGFGGGESNSLLDTNGSASGTANESRIGDLYLLGMVDTDNDQQPDYLDQDSDNDGLPDALERGSGVQGANRNNLWDEDGDGIANYLDLDSDNDSVFDAVEADTFNQINADADRDGIIDQFDVTNTGGVDANSDGVDDNIGLIDRDNDGKPDYSDTDSDNDGLSDLTEYGGEDLDGDGYIDQFTDTDNNGVHDGLTLALPPEKDTDGDGISDTHDIDTDGDGVPDVIEIMMQRGGDIDRDGLSAQLDLDSDNDGIADGVEFGALFKDADNDDIDDRFDVDASGGTDTNADGIDDQFQFTTRFDTDGDGVINASDTDSDNDGIPDAVEFGFINAVSDIDSLSFVDENGDGLNDNLAAAYVGAALLTPISDVDGDGSPDYIDADSDDDGLPDALERADVVVGFDIAVGAGSDLGASAGTGAGTVAPAGGTTIVDTDGDGIANHLDIDSDNDGIHDRFEARSLSMDADQDGVINLFDVDGTGGVDANKDGIDDRLTRWSLLDSDRDSIPDHLDLDSDADGLYDLVEAGRSDLDNDGRVDGFKDIDQNGANDGHGELGLIPPDTDKDGAADNIDSDADNDGVPDFAETNRDGVSVIDTDEDGLPDFQDNDSDNDGISDGQEAGFVIRVDGDNTATTVSGEASGGVRYFAIPVYRLIDSDGDGLHDFRDTDADNDGISDAEERGVSTLPVDSDDDGIADYLDKDSDSDGIPDLLEGIGDADHDGLVDRLDSDSDNDGIADAFETGLPLIDSDSDGIIDSFDADYAGALDANLDGISDLSLTNGLADIDADGIPDFRDTDTDGDGIADSIEVGNVLSGVDTDGDGVADFISTDSDGDGVPDAVEYGGAGAKLSGVDSDNDSIPDYRDTDSDNDGISDSVEAGYIDGSLRDTDGDGTPDMRDTDSDNDSVTDAIEGALDTDADGRPDYLDEDANNDGILDSEQGTADADGDGMVDRLKITLNVSSVNESKGVVSASDSDGDGIADSIESGLSGLNVTQAEPLDTDRDSVPDMFDLDSDNDGIADQIEAGSGSTGPRDTDNDGQYDFRDGDSDNDGVEDAIEGRLDFDSDGQYDAIDLDSDNDGVPDAIELHIDSDGDGVVNRHDLDSDNDGVSDTLEAGLDRITISSPDSDLATGIDSSLAVDTDADGIADFLDTDSDNDGLSDSIESRGFKTPTSSSAGTSAGTADKADKADTADTADTPDTAVSIVSSEQTLVLVDTDGDGIPDLRDTDSDNDGTDDAAELSVDTDGDGVPDYLDRDSNGNGIDDQLEQTQDSDGDGIPDRIDSELGSLVPVSGNNLIALIDTDNDGIPDSIEGSEDHDFDGLANKFDSDSDNDGLLDEIEAGFTLITVRDSDADGHPDYLDNDSDNDGLSDLAENVGPQEDENFDGFIDDFIDNDRNGVDDSIDVLPVYPNDLDNDGIPNYLDLDTDGDGVFDLVEVNGTDVDNDGVVDGMRDSDADTIPDKVDVDQTNGADADADGIDDKADADFIAGGLDIDRDGIADVFDIDTDGNGYASTGIDDGAPSSNWPDSNGDGIPDVRQRITDTPQIAAAGPLNDQGIIRTGTDGQGSGCSISASFSSRPDPSMWLLLVSAIGALLFRWTRRPN